MLDLESVNDGRKLAKYLICLFVELELGSNQVGKVSEGLWSIEYLEKLIVKGEIGCDAYILHDANSLLSLSDELVLSLLDLNSSLLRSLLLTMIRRLGLLTW